MAAVLARPVVRVDPRRRAACTLELRMHELALMEEVVTTVTRASLGVRVHLVRLVVGDGALVSPAALRTCFDVCVRGTVLDGARLDIVRTAGQELRLEELEVS